MSGRVQCPECLTMMAVDARFCPGCGTPRTWVRDELEREAARSGTPYATLLERARQGTLRLSEPEDMTPAATSSNRPLIATVLAIVTIPFAIGLVAVGANWIVIAGLIVAIAILYSTMQGRIDQLESRLSQLESRSIESALRGVGERVTADVQPMPLRPEPAVQAEPKVVVPEAPPLVAASVRQEQPAAGWATTPTLPTPEPAISTPRSIGDIEDLLSGRILAWVGGLAIFLGAVFFLSLAFSRGWIGPEGRVAIGIGASVLMLLAGGWFFERRERIVGHVLVAVGLGVMSLSLLAATSFYDLIAVEVALLGTLVSALVAAAIAIRANSQVVALFGLVAALAAPPVLGADADGTTIAFLSLTLVGTTAIALFRSWSWLPPVAFILTAPQIGIWIADDAPVGAGMLILAGFWLLNAIAAGGEEIRHRSREAILRTVSATVLLGNAAFVVWGGFQLLDGEHEGWRGVFLVVVAIAHGLLGGWFLVQRDERHPFGLLAAGTGIAAFSMAIPVQLGGPVVPIAWAAEAAALAWVYARRRNGYCAGVALALLAGALAHLVIIEYPFWEFGESVADTPFLNASGGTLAFILGALVVGGWLVRQIEVRIGLAVLGVGLLLYALPFELSGMWLLAALATLAVAVFAFDQWLDRVPGFAAVPGSPARRALLLPAAASAVFAAAHALAIELPLDEVATWNQPDTPFTSDQTLAAVILIVAALAAAAVTRWQEARVAGILVATGVAAYLMPFELGPAAMVVAWAMLAGVLLLVSTRLRDDFHALPAGAATLAVLGLAVTFTQVAPPERLFVDAESQINHTAFLSGATAALAALALLLIGLAWRYRARHESRWLVVGAGALGVYLLSVGTVDIFQARVGGETSLDSLEKQAQVALSILWAVLGVTAFVAGILRGRTLSGAPLRGAGLALLALATVKVFIYDMASLDASYRVLSFIGLGILLLASSYVYQRLAPNRRPPIDAASG